MSNQQRPSTIRQALGNPRKALRVSLAIAKGKWLRLRCKLSGQRLVGGAGLRIYGKLDVRGPGVVELGDGIVVEMRATAWTYTPEARIAIGANSFVNGTRFGCTTEITIGSHAILAESHIFDSDFHSTAANRWDPDAVVRKRPVRVANNVWIAANAGVLPGTTIGENSVVAFGAICSGTFPANSIIAGNPARVIKPIPEAVEKA